MRSLSSMLSRLFGRGTPAGATNEQAADLFGRRYNAFRDLLESNSELLGIISGLQEMLDGETVFGRPFISTQTSRLLFHATRMVSSLDTLSGGRYPDLAVALARIRGEMDALVTQPRHSGATPYVLPLSQLSRLALDTVGAKAANLGELKRLGLPVPEGFAVSTAGFDAFMGHEGLLDDILRRAREIMPDDPASIREASDDIQKIVMQSALPADLEQALAEAWASLAARGVTRCAMRSSAVGEDGELSYAGQYATVLNVDGASMVETYRQVVASLFSERAITYRLFMGEPLEASAMSVLCLEMVDAVAGGVLYTRNPVPFAEGEEHMVLDAVWGLGAYAVDGEVTPDRFVLSHDDPPCLLSSFVADKHRQLLMNPEGGVTPADVPQDKRQAPCLSPAQCIELGAMGLRIEAHYGSAQDIEWALGRDGGLVLLQARPLKMELEQQVACIPVAGETVLLEGGDCAASGVGCGTVLLLDEENIPAGIPSGTILVVRHPSPRFVPVLVRAEGLVAETGSLTGHLASLAREFQIPALFNAEGASELLRQGDVVTLDAACARVYAGEVAAVLERKAEKMPVMAGTAMLELLRKIADLVIPLYLTDPASGDFRPDSCRTVHDLMRFAHEVCYKEMFRISDMLSNKSVSAVRLQAALPVDLHVIDLGGGLHGSDGFVTRDGVLSEPFAALLDGMLDPAVAHGAPRPVSLQGFLSVMSRQMLEPPTAGDQRFGERSYAIVSDRYLNFSSRVGYHYSVLDAFCGQAMDSNYVHFEFKGGAAGEERRSRRVQALARILSALGFVLEVRGDRVVARFRKYDREETVERITALGRLLIYSRQMDMLMHDDASVQMAAEHFINGEYRRFS